MNRVLTKEETEAVLEILAKELAVQKCDLLPEATLVGDLGADSLTIIEITMALEEKFDISLSDEQAEHLQTVGDVLERLTEVLASTASVQTAEPRN
jgi:acyl carrier protein